MMTDEVSPIVQCLQIAAARGRAIRLKREAQREGQTTPSIGTDPLADELDLAITMAEQEEADTQDRESAPRAR